jgi:hypothetical protein
MAQAAKATAVADPDRKVTFQREIPSASSDDEAPEVDRVEMNSACSDGRGLDLPTEAEDATSIAGDTASEAEDSETDPAVAAQRRQLRCAPKKTYHLNTEPQVPAQTNENYPVGNASLFFGNWGTRGTVAGTQEKRDRREAHDRQILKQPCLCVSSLRSLYPYGRYVGARGNRSSSWQGRAGRETHGSKLGGSRQ